MNDLGARGKLVKHYSCIAELPAALSMQLQHKTALYNEVRVKHPAS